jgi:hypothetical protein
VCSDASLEAAAVQAQRLDTALTRYGWVVRLPRPGEAG